MKRYWLNMLLMGLACATPVEAKDYIKLGSWNIENLGARGTGQNRFALAEYLQLADVDVLALQEIHDTDDRATTRTNQRLDQVIQLLNELDGHQWKYELFSKSDTSDSERLIGIAWNTERVEKVGGTYRIPINNQGGVLWDRHPHAIKFRTNQEGKNDFVVIPVHMKSNWDGPRQAARQRTREAQALADAYDQVVEHFGDQDIIVLGDTNCLKADEEALRVLTSLGLKDLNEGDAQTFISGGPFDRILIPEEQPEFKYSTQYVLAPANLHGHERYLSDHYLVMTAVQIQDDDDVSAPRTARSGNNRRTSSPTVVAIPATTNEPPATDQPASNGGYYAAITNGLSGEQLKAALHRLIRGHRAYTYGELWDALSYTDQDPEDPDNVVLLYTGWSSSNQNNGGGVSQWNREHVWAKSKGDFGTSTGAGTDMHHIRPTDVTVNAKRGSLSFDNGGEFHRDNDGPTECRFDDDSWEPRDEVKGDVARMVFYMVVRYEGGGLDLELVDDVVSPRSKSPRLGKLSTLLEWHRDDPPSEFERRRNQRVFELQGNRNPFIDHPEWAETIWSN